MFGKYKKYINLARNLGWRYVSFRTQHEALRRSGLLKGKFPANPPYKQYMTLEGWKNLPVKFFFGSREELNFPKAPTPELEQHFKDIKAGKLQIFNGDSVDIGQQYDWITNFDTGHKYDTNLHWTEIADYSKAAGDIKVVWEKSRFSYLYTIIRYDHHFSVDCAEIVFGDILSWIAANPVNMGPNYRCSQEMSLRLLNWTFALFYYRNSPALTEDVFNKMQHVIYWHLHHIYNNINFSRIAVRNNHAITETLALYLGGILYQGMPGSETWKKRGKAWFEQEIEYQIYEDGSFLQFSMNYHRVVVQLLTWGILLADQNRERFADIVYKRAKKTFQFLRTCMIDESGWLPNYGANDGSLFFKLNDAHYRDYRPQLQALAAAIGTEARFADHVEDTYWYGAFENARKPYQPETGLYRYTNGGYYLIRETDTLTFIKCGSYKDRPQQADDLHMDVWYKGKNLLPDGGSYKYNTDDATIRYFSGTESHNTVMLDGYDQMLKGGRFIWYYWSKAINAELTEKEDEYVFNGAINAFNHLKNGVIHRRTIVKKKGQPIWEVKDEILNAPPNTRVEQLWHTFPEFRDALSLSAKSRSGTDLPPEHKEGWYSSFYRQKEQIDEIVFSTKENLVVTRVEVKESR